MKSNELSSMNRISITFVMFQEKVYSYIGSLVNFIKSGIFFIGNLVKFIKRGIFYIGNLVKFSKCFITRKGSNPPSTCSPLAIHLTHASVLSCLKQTLFHGWDQVQVLWKFGRIDKLIYRDSAKVFSSLENVEYPCCKLATVHCNIPMRENVTLTPVVNRN